MPGQKCWNDFQNSTQNTSLPPHPLQCCPVAVFIYSLNDFSGYQQCLGEGGLPKLHNDGTTKLKITGYSFAEHKRTLQMLFSYLSQKIIIGQDCRSIGDGLAGR